ncbi:ER protein BIG1 [Xylariaceae sp. FL0016]|nr:ER protein BIG1 [Xylariaceae sp. FL0016]
MRLSTAATVAALCASAQAFSDTTPFILFSTAKLPNAETISQDALKFSSSVLSSTKQLLAACPTDRYLLVSQPNLNHAHLTSVAAAPNLVFAMNRAETRWGVSEVAGELDLSLVRDYIMEKCGVESNAIDEVGLEPVWATGSEAALKSNDDELGIVLDQYKAESSYTVIYTGGLRTEKPETYTPEFQNESGMRTELKRQVHDITRRMAKPADPTPLFEKYQFFTPGIFVGLIATIVLMSILYAGVSAVASLDVSYGAFDKDMGPSAQKKQQ